MKLYRISAHGARPKEGLVEHAIAIATKELAASEDYSTHYGLGWITVHEGIAGNYVLVDWWSDQDIVQHRLYGAPHDGGETLTLGWPSGAAFCVWEMAVSWHERQAWVQHILSKAHAPDIDGYLSAILVGDV